MDAKGKTDVTNPGCNDQNIHTHTHTYFFKCYKSRGENLNGKTKTAPTVTSERKSHKHIMEKNGEVRC